MTAKVVVDIYPRADSAALSGVRGDGVGRLELVLFGHHLLHLGAAPPYTLVGRGYVYDLALSITAGEQLVVGGKPLAGQQVDLIAALVRPSDVLGVTEVDGRGS